MKMKLIVCDPTDPKAISAMQDAGIEVDVRDDITPEGLEAVIAGYDAMVVRSRTKVREPLIDKATNLKVIIRGGVGLDNIDVKYAESKGIEVRNTPSASSNSVANSPARHWG
jgi:phosphoglycerate dehydrogenase-like enzyme